MMVLNNKKITTLFTGLLLCVIAMGQGASVAPSRFFFKTAPGETETQVLRITNTTSAKQSYLVSFSDFEPEGSLGKTRMVQHGVSVHSLKGAITASPNFIELGPGETQDVNLVLSLPNVPESNQVKWGAVTIRLAREQKEGQAENQMGFGILETFQFVVYVFQTPPSASLMKAEITGFSNTNTGVENSLTLSVANTGEAIVNCASYVELTSYSTGKVERIGTKAFTMLPDTKRDIFYAIPDSIPAGTYSALAVVDFGSREEVEAAEMELKIEGK